MKRGATIDPTGCYRYRLWREWQDSGSRVGWIMLNPSTADAQQDDPTIRRCMSLSRTWGYGSLEVMNLFAYRSTRPQGLTQVHDPVGPENDTYLLALRRRADCLVLAWGNQGGLWGRHQQVLELLGDTAVCCLGLTQGGHPRHPLYIKSNTLPMRFPGFTPPSSIPALKRSELTRWK